MSTPPPPSPAPVNAEEFSDSDQQWFDQLTGRASAVTDAAAVREGAVLRGVLQRADAAADANSAQADDMTAEARQRRWEQIRFRQRRQGADTTARPWWKRRQALGALAASVLAGVLIVQSLPDNTVYYDEPPTLRGEFVLIALAVAKPRRAAEDLAQALRTAGLQAVLHQDGKKFTVDALVAADTSPAALEVLRRLGAKGQRGAHRIEFVPG